MNNDVTGFSWAVAPGPQPGRIQLFRRRASTKRGRRAPLRRPNPFYWQSPDGSRILVWNGEHYMFSNMKLHLHLGNGRKRSRASPNI